MDETARMWSAINATQQELVGVKTKQENIITTLGRIENKVDCLDTKFNNSVLNGAISKGKSIVINWLVVSIILALTGALITKICSLW